MDDYSLPTANAGKSKRRIGVVKSLILLLVVVLAFGGGVWTGRQSEKNKTGGSGTALNYSSVDAVYNLLQKDFDGTLDTTKLLDGAKTGLVSATGDPYTDYFSPSQAKDFNEALSGSFSGIGAEIGSDKQNRVVIVSPLSGYPAAKAGLQPKDVIVSIDGQSTDGFSVDQAVQKIRGPVGSTVTLSISRNSGAPFTVKITRKQITLPSVTSSISHNIGYLKISQFTDDTVKLADAAAANFKAKHVKGIILDLRGNPGGFLDGAVKVSSLWLNNGQTVVTERRGDTVTGTQTAEGDNVLKGLPTVVLIDGGSASASEITAGALHDNHDATLVGVTSFGKGSVQTVETLGDGSEVKITIAHWYTPDGKNINKQGINPDVVVKMSTADVKAGQDPQKAKATQLLQAKF